MDDATQPTDPPPTPVAYEGTGPGVTRGAFRVLLLLTFINTVLLGTYVLGPGLTGIFKQQWADYQQRRAERAAVAAAAATRAAYLPAQQQCLDYLAPTDRLIYAEDPGGVRQLASAGVVNAAASHGGNDLPLSLQWMPAVAATDPPCTGPMPADLYLRDTNHGTLFLHARQVGPTGPVRLVDVTVRGSQEVHETGVSEDRRNFGISNVRTLTSRVIAPATAGDFGRIAEAVSTDLNDRRMTLVTEATDGPKPTYRIDYAGQLRLYAGQPDATDPARFTIRYDLDGVRGTIVGQLLPGDHLTLTPDGPLAAAALVVGSPGVPSPGERVAKGMPR